ncbi:MAG TPA: hypothetical protein VGN72_07560 [Tepidisphaeraceae bacterium]|jgi:hypothetical protein|nr:hypothetical protein [Tepidisphaeraceae bacterium]
MAWIQVSEQGHLSESEQTNDEKTAKRVFVAISDTPTTTVAAETATVGAASIPARGAGHPHDATRKVTSISASTEKDGKRKVFTVEVGYSDKINVVTVEPNPLNRTADVTWDFDDSTEPYFIDKSSTPKPVVNSAKERFEQFLERETGSLTATITKNIPTSGAGSYSVVAALDLKDTVNAGSITVDGVPVPAGKAKLKSWTVGGVQTETVNGVAVTYRQSKVLYQFRSSWDHVVEDRGFNEKDGTTGKLKTIVKGDKDPTPVETAWPLDGAGAKKTNISDTPAELTFKPYASVAHTSLPLA